MRRPNSIPWWFKIGVKLFLARLPVNQAVWARLGVFRLGDMANPDYALGVFSKHFARFQQRYGARPYTALELGPGESLFSAVIAPAFGARSCYLIDSGSYATSDVARYRTMAGLLRDRGLPAPDLTDADSLDAVLQRCGAVYATAGLRSLRDIPTGSIDFIWSHAVLEHVPAHEFVPLIRELKRVLSPDGVSSHAVDLRDHLASALNHLRFADGLWESKVLANSGFYTNRLRCAEMLAIFEQAGFQTDVVDVARWDAVPTPRTKMAERFRRMPDDELRIMGFDVVLHPAA